MDLLELSLSLSVVLGLPCLAAIQCFKIKYGSSREIDKLREEIKQLDKKIVGVNAEAVKDLKLEVKSLRNHYGLVSRK